MKTKLLKFTKLHLTKLLSIFFFILLFSSYLSTFAIGQPYNPGETLDPSCAPGDTNCTVNTIPTPSGSNSQIQFNNNGLFAGSPDLTWMQGSSTPFSLGPDITFTRPNSEFPTDIISPSVQLTRGDTKGLYNPLSEPFYDNNTYLSPLGTEWNSAEGWTDLSDISTRTYTTFRDALGGSVNSNILPAELVMHDIAQDTYYKVDFTSWTTNANGGGFAYTRNLIDPTTFALGPDVSFSKADYEIISTPPPTDDVSSFVHITRGSSQSIYNAVTESSYSGGTSPADTEWNSDGWGTLTDVDTRTYTDFNSSLGGNIGNNVLPAELVMHDINDNKYYKVDFTSWTTGGGGGGFSYTRNLINLGTSTENQLTSNSNLLIGGTDRYLNFGTTSGTSGYGVRDVAGVLQYKNDGGSWANLGGGGGGSLIGSTSTTGSETWLGTSVADMGTASTYNTVFLGVNAGQNATGANYSNFLGLNAGRDAPYASYSNFLGQGAGYNATHASLSNFLGDAAGYNATNAANSIFIGNNAGSSDTVDNTVSGTSILIGDDTRTGGYSNSIVLGPTASNTMTNQFLISPTYSNFRIRDIDYIMPAAQATGAGQVLTNNGSGGLSWATAGTSLLGSTSAISYETWLGTSVVDMGTASTFETVFLGLYAGQNATNASYSNFLGDSAGKGATNAYYSNLFGFNAGYNATNAANSIFIGANAGSNDIVNNTSIDTSILIGNNTHTGGYSNSIALGANATNSAANQFLIGSTYTQFNMRGLNYTMPTSHGSSGYVLTNNGSGTLTWASAGGTSLLGSTSSLSTETWLGTSAGGLGTASRANTVFIGRNAGQNANNANYSNFIGLNTGIGATGAYDSNFMGEYAGYGASNAYQANFFGYQAGYGATDASYSTFIGQNAGNGASGAGASNFIGSAAGQTAINAVYSNFLGLRAGSGATNSDNSNFLGQNAGYQATGAASSNFLGQNAGMSAASAWYSNFMGKSAGYNAINAGGSNFLGFMAGNQASNASYSNLIGYRVGVTFPSNNLGSNNIIIGTNISLPNATANAINLGGVLFGTGTYSTTGGDPSITPASGGKIGIGVVTPAYTLDVSTGGVAGVVAQFTNSTGYCRIDPTSTALTCSSDISLKKNITNLGDNSPFTLTSNLDMTGKSITERLTSLIPVTYNWNGEQDTDTKHAGFIAQQVQQVFPELVSADPSTNLLSLNTIGMIPYMINTIQAMDLRVKGIETISDDSTFTSSLKNWFASATNGIMKLFVKEIETEKLCVGKVCVTEDQFLEIVSKNITPTPSSSPTTPQVPEVTPAPTPDPTQPEETPVTPTEPTPTPEVPPTVETPVVEPTPTPIEPPVENSQPVVETTPIVEVSEVITQ